MKREDKIEDSKLSLRMKIYCKSYGIETIGQLVDSPTYQLNIYARLSSRWLKIELEDIKYDLENETSNND